MTWTTDIRNISIEKSFSGSKRNVTNIFVCTTRRLRCSISPQTFSLLNVCFNERKYSSSPLGIFFCESSLGEIYDDSMRWISSDFLSLDIRILILEWKLNLWSLTSFCFKFYQKNLKFLKRNEMIYVQTAAELNGSPYLDSLMTWRAPQSIKQFSFIKKCFARPFDMKNV